MSWFECFDECAGCKRRRMVAWQDLHPTYDNRLALCYVGFKYKCQNKRETKKKPLVPTPNQSSPIYFSDKDVTVFIIFDLTNFIFPL